jgi:hypothetical protein
MDCWVQLQFISTLVKYNFEYTNEEALLTASRKLVLTLCKLDFAFLERAIFEFCQHHEAQLDATLNNVMSTQPMEIEDNPTVLAFSQHYYAFICELVSLAMTAYSKKKQPFIPSATQLCMHTYFHTRHITLHHIIIVIIIITTLCLFSLYALIITGLKSLSVYGEFRDVEIAHFDYDHSHSTFRNNPQNWNERCHYSRNDERPILFHFYHSTAF